MVPMLRDDLDAARLRLAVRASGDADLLQRPCGLGFNGG